MKESLIFLLFGLLFYSCDPGVSYKRIIENNSSYDIYIKTDDYSFSDFSRDSFLISKNTEQVIYIYSGLGQTFEFENCGMIDSAIIGGIVEIDSLTIIKDLNVESSWNFSILEETYKEGGKCECRLTISNDDIK